MILKSVIDLNKNIENYRRDMYELVKNKDILDPDVIRISHRLDEEVLIFQKILDKINSL
ncbi:aspartyl-phosphate phosphatase Spo0E family protein [Priestia aryabhattai]|uniref:aspartyl-phosphate phosphatase Spo0E family protein n=1 Tax=Priestia aryabhattai TaxID=412384 RepID=UPI003D2AFA50